MSDDEKYKGLVEAATETLRLSDLFRYMHEANNLAPPPEPEHLVNLREALRKVMEGKCKP